MFHSPAVGKIPCANCFLGFAKILRRSVVTIRPSDEVVTLTHSGLVLTAYCGSANFGFHVTADHMGDGLQRFFPMFIVVISTIFR